MDELLHTRLETIVAMSNAINEAIVKSGETHGVNDPHMGHIVSSAITLSIRDLNRLSPGFAELMKHMLEAEHE